VGVWTLSIAMLGFSCTALNERRVAYDMKIVRDGAVTAMRCGERGVEFDMCQRRFGRRWSRGEGASARRTQTAVRGARLRSVYT
jgi:hypothetical protein